MKPMMILVSVLLATINPRLMADVTVYTSKATWQAQAGPHTTIAFTGFPQNTPIVEQYADLGVHFTDGIDLVHYANGFLNDGVGLNGAFDETTLEFDAPMTTFAVDFPGAIQISLFSDNQLIYSNYFVIGGPGHFRGLISTQPFDEVQLFDGGLFIDDLHFGPPIPAPGTLAVVGITALLARLRRRSRSTS